MNVEKTPKDFIFFASSGWWWVAIQEELSDTFLITEVFLIKSDDQSACFSDSKTTVSFIELAIAGVSYITRYYTTAKFNTN